MKICQDLRLYIKDNMPKVSHITPFAFWDMRTQDMSNVCLKHTQTMEYVKN